MINSKKKIDESTLNKVLFMLMDANVTGIGVHYEGGGDSGYIDDIYWTKDKDFSFDNADEKFTWDSPSLKDLHLEAEQAQVIYDTIESICEDEVLDNIEDWYNNEGGHGYVYMEIPSGEFQIHNHIRRTEYDTYYHDGKILEKTTHINL